MGIKVGIDLGTTFSAVAMIDEKKGQPVIIPNIFGEKITPSVIQFTEDDEIIVGTEAKEAFEAGESGCTSVFKRSIGSQDAYCSFNGKRYTAEDLSSILLRYLKEETERVTNQSIEEAVVTVPAYFYHKERQATINAAKKAGLKIRQIINEPTAAAINYGLNHWRENARILVYDLGGGTFDVTIVQMKKRNQMESLQTIGDHTLGGKDWDSRISMIIEDKIEGEIGLSVIDHPEIHQIVIQSAESVKKQLTAYNIANVRINIPDYGWYSTTLSLEEFEQNTSDLIERTGTLCESLLDGLKITWVDITDILLVGGSTRMRQVITYLKRISGHTPLSQVNPDEAVALGAAIQVHLPLPEYSVLTIAHADDNKSSSDFSSFKFKKAISHLPTTPTYSSSGVIGKEIALKNALCMSHVDVVAHAMGIIAVNTEGTWYINKTIIPANQKIPVKCAEAFHYYTSAHGDNEIEIYVLQGTKSPLECPIIGKYVVSGITHNREDNPTTIKIQYSYDINGMVHVQARQGNSTLDLPICEKSVPSDMSKYGQPIESKDIKPAVEPLFVVMAVDVSGSMSGKPIEDALDAMCHFVDNFEGYPGSVQIGVIAVSDTSKIVQSLTSNLIKCKSSIRSITDCMTGVCNDGHPFNDIKAMLSKEKGRKIAIVLADGMWSYQDQAVSAAHSCHCLGIDITGIGFGSADKKFLKDISHGNVHAMLVNQSELSQSFGKIAQEIGGETNSNKRRTSLETSVATWLAINED